MWNVTLSLPLPGIPKPCSRVIGLCFFFLQFCMPRRAVWQTVHRLARLSRTAWLIIWLAQAAWAGGCSPSLAWRARTHSPLQKTCISFLMGDQVRLTLCLSLALPFSLSLPPASCHLQCMVVITTLHYNTTTLPSSSLLYSLFFHWMFSDCRLSQWVAFPLLVICCKTDHWTKKNSLRHFEETTDFT